MKRDDAIGANADPTNKMAQEIEDVKKELGKVKRRIKKVEKEITKVGGEIEDASTNEKLAKSDEERQHWREEKSKMRDEKSKLREKESQLRSKENKLMDKETDLRRAARPHGFICEFTYYYHRHSPLHILVPMESYKMQQDYYAIAKDVKLPTDEQLRDNPNGILVDVGPLLELLFESSARAMLVRSCYGQIFNKLIFDDQRRHGIISGTPGIGKSTFLLYVLIRLVQDGQPVCFYDLSSKDTLIFAKKTCERLPHRGQSHKFQGEFASIVVLLDNPKGHPSLFPKTMGTTILATSPKHDNHNEFSKGNFSTSLGYIFMPIWSLPELQNFRQLCGRTDIDSQKLVERFNLVGGVFRVVFGSDIGYNDYASRLLGELSNEKLIRIVWNHEPNIDIFQDTPEKGVSDKIVHYIVNANFKLSYLSFCSQNAFNIHLERLAKTNPAKLLFSCTNGKEYETAVLTAMQHCSSLLVRPLPSTAGDFATMTCNIRGPDFDVLRDLSDADIDGHLHTRPANPCMLIPKSATHPAFDGYLWNCAKWYPLQVTVNEQKHPRSHLLKAFFDTHPSLRVNGKLEWYLVCPPSLALRADKFTFEHDPNHAKDRNWAHSNVEQFVIPFPRPDDAPQGYSDEHVRFLSQMKSEIFSKVLNDVNILTNSSSNKKV